MHTFIYIFNLLLVRRKPNCSYGATYVIQYIQYTYKQKNICRYVLYFTIKHVIAAGFELARVAQYFRGIIWDSCMMKSETFNNLLIPSILIHPFPPPLLSMKANVHYIVLIEANNNDETRWRCSENRLEVDVAGRIEGMIPVLLVLLPTTPALHWHFFRESKIKP